MSKSVKSSLPPVLMAVLIAFSDFLGTNLFQTITNDMLVWILLSGLCFAAGWFTIKNYDWKSTLQIVLSVTVANMIISAILVSYFPEYFLLNGIIVENILIFGIRNILLGAMGLFGAAVAENLSVRQEKKVMEEKLKVYESTMKDVHKESDLVLREAQIKAAKLLLEAESAAKNLFLKKERIEKELKEFIQIEKALIKKYEEQG